ncbi:Six-bladed beta-propeller, TolB-like [Fusarium oxysporum f. sp. vasinfectum]|nr:Six-bladed beta-propeller, TolB-like [Fusarium oxysporum f. sp. vasinfectum]KAK2925530.1 Six-bladed beta-propeller, TolB-like [Fusarium oxysporum f. sp. vasinfectum]
MPSSISVLAGVLVPVLGAVAAKLPSTAQIIDQKSFNVLKDVPPPAVANDSLVFTWPGVTEESLLEKPFHVYDEEFYDVIGKDPSLTLIATSDTDPIFHEAVVWYPPTEEVFFVQNAGAPAAGTGLNKSSIIQKISLKEADAVRKGKQDEVKVTVVDSNPQVINPNGKLSGTYYKGNIIFAGEGQGDDVPSALYLMNPLPPYNTTTLLNNYFGRQFNSLNDVGINPRNGDLYFTDTLYGYLQDFRPVPGLRNQVYRYNFDTGAVTVVADDFTLPNGIGFGPDGKKVYVTDTGIALGFYGRNLSSPASVYSFDVNQDGTLQNRKTFAYVASFIPDGVHTDSKGRVYAGCGDGVHVWNPSGKLIGKIYTGTVAANFQFAGPAETCNQRTQPLTPAGGCTVISGLPLRATPTESIELQPFGYQTFYVWGTIVHDLLLDQIPGDRDKILSRLRRIQRRHEIKSSQGPPFRPAFVPLYDDDQVENMLGIPDFEQAKSDLPAFVSIPTIQLDKPRPRTFPEISHHVKFLLQYHYRFGMHNGTVQKPHFDLASILVGIRSPCVRQMWCLTLDSSISGSFIQS